MFKRIFLLGMLLIFMLNVSYAQNKPNRLPVLVINEVDNRDYLRDNAFIELLVLKIDEVPYDLSSEKPAIIIDDSNLVGIEPGFLSIKPECLSTVQPGDLIVIHGKNANTNGALPNTILFDINDDCIEKWEDVPNASNPTYENGSKVIDNNSSFKDFISFKGSGDMIQSKAGEMINFQLPQSSAKNYSLSEGDLSTYSNLTPTLGKGNNKANDQLISSIYKFPCSDFRVEVEVTNVNNVEVSSSGGPAPPNGWDYHQYTFDGETVDVSFGFNYTFTNVPCGNYQLKVQNAKCVRTINVEVEIPDQVYVQWCDSAPFNLNDYMCDIDDAYCMDVLLNGDPYQGSISSMNLTPGNHEIVVQSTDGQGNAFDDQTIYVEVLSFGSPCDDGNPCTRNDMVAENCDCIGNPIEYEVSIVQGCGTSQGLELTATTFPEEPTAEFEWSTGETTEVITVQSTGIYEVTVSVPNGDESCQGSSRTDVMWIPTGDGDSDDDGTCNYKEEEDCIEDTPNFPCKDEQYFANEGFTCQEFAVVYGNLPPQPCGTEVNTVRWETAGILEVFDYTAQSLTNVQLDLESPSPECPIDDWRINLQNNFYDWLNASSTSFSSAAIYISDNQSMCATSTGQQAYEDAEVGIWIHLWKGQDFGCLCYKAKGLPNSQAYNFLFKIPPPAKVQGVEINSTQLTDTEFIDGTMEEPIEDGSVAAYSNFFVGNSSGVDFVNESIGIADVYNESGAATTYKFIVSSDGAKIGVPGKVETPSAQLAKEDFDGTNDKNFVFWVHKNKDNSVVYCIKTFDVKYEGEIKGMAEFVAARDNQGEVQASAEVAPDTDGVGGDPMFMGKREKFNQEVNFWNIITQACSIGKEIGDTGELPRKCWDKLDPADEGKVMWDFSGTVCGPIAGFIEENPVAAAVQFINLIKGVCSAEIKKEQILEVMRHPIKNAMAFMHQAWEQIKNDWNDPETRHYTIGKTSVQVIMKFLNGFKSLTDLLSSATDPNVGSLGVKNITKNRPADLNHPFNRKIKELLDDADAQKLSKDIDDVPDLEDYLINTRPEAVKGYKFALDHKKMRKHPATIGKITDLLDDADFMAKLPDGEQGLKNILDAVKNPLDGGTNAKLIKLSDHLENIRTVVKNQDPGVVQQIYKDLKNKNFSMQDGITHMVNDVKEFAPNSIKKVDYEFTGDGVVCNRCKFDVELKQGPPSLIEYKSWSLQYIPNLKVRQFNEYFRTASKIDDIKYVFNHLKTPKISDIKVEMKGFFNKNVDEIWDVLKDNQALLDDLIIDNLDDFKLAIDNLDPRLYSFIEITD